MNSREQLASNITNALLGTFRGLSVAEADYIKKVVEEQLPSLSDFDLGARVDRLDLKLEALHRLVIAHLGPYKRSDEYTIPIHGEIVQGCKDELSVLRGEVPKDGEDEQG